MGKTVLVDVISSVKTPDDSTSLGKGLVGTELDSGKIDENGGTLAENWSELDSKVNASDEELS